MFVIVSVPNRPIRWSWSATSAFVKLIGSSLSAAVSSSAVAATSLPTRRPFWLISVTVRECVAAVRARRVLRRVVRPAHSLRLRSVVAAALVVGVASWVSVATPALADEVCPQPSGGAFCGQSSGSDSDSGVSSFSGRFSVESECSLPAYQVPVSELPSGSLPDWVPSEGGQACVQIVYSIPTESDQPAADETPGNEQWRAQLTSQFGTFQQIGLLLIFLLAALFMRTKARV